MSGVWGIADCGLRPTDTTSVPAQACDAGIVDAVDEVDVVDAVAGGS